MKLKNNTLQNIKQNLIQIVIISGLIIFIQYEKNSTFINIQLF